MKEELETKSYKSPRRKLIRFFEKSRNQWKAKCHEAKSTVKQLKNRVRFLEESRQQWKIRTKELEGEIAQMKAKEQAREREEKELKKNLEGALAPEQIEEFSLAPAHHKYSFGHIILFISLVLSAAASLRCASRSLEVVISSLQPGLASPSWFCGRLWILRLAACRRGNRVP